MYAVQRGKQTKKTNERLTSSVKLQYSNSVNFDITPETCIW